MVYVGEIRMFAGDYAPLGWALCWGQTLDISQAPHLFAVIGTTYGGDGQTTFVLPDLRSRVPMHAGIGFDLGQAGGSETITLTAQQLPTHIHPPVITESQQQQGPVSGSYFASALSEQDGVLVYSSANPDVAFNPAAVGTAGESQPHNNMVPFLAITFIIALRGD